VILPIHAALPELLRTLGESPNAVLVAPPGAGKTTVVPLALLEQPWAPGRIIVLEPRRMAARAAARRMAKTMGQNLGELVGYRVRGDSRVSAATRVEVVTEGVFTRMILDDPDLDGVSAVLFDEFHERSLDADLGLAFALDAQAVLRPDLRLLVMSATLDGARVAGLLGGAPVLRSEGRAYPVDTRYLPRNPAASFEEEAARAVRRALGDEVGSLLVFLPGQAEIRRVERLLADRMAPDVLLAPLFGALSPAEQDRAVDPAPPGCRKVVLATSIAETSLTIEGVRGVVDGGLSREPRFDPASGLTRLATVRVSQAAADQRRGRAGRTGPVCAGASGASPKPARCGRSPDRRSWTAIFPAWPSIWLSGAPETRRPSSFSTPRRRPPWRRRAPFSPVSGCWTDTATSRSMDARWRNCRFRPGWPT
jgi:ATP-dependent helicase HrpB